MLVKSVRYVCYSQESNQNPNNFIFIFRLVSSCVDETIFLDLIIQQLIGNHIDLLCPGGATKLIKKKGE